MGTVTLNIFPKIMRVVVVRTPDKIKSSDDFEAIANAATECRMGVVDSSVDDCDSGACASETGLVELLYASHAVKGVVCRSLIVAERLTLNRTDDLQGYLLTLGVSITP